MLGVAAAVAMLLCACGSSSPPVAALPPPVHRIGPESIFTPGPPLKSDPAGTLDILRRLGVDRVRVFVTWNQVAPDPTAVTKPNFDATDPAAYPASAWSAYDAVVRDTAARRMGLDMVLGPPPPRWAAAPGAPQPAEHTYWRPSAADFEQFTQAVARRYSGSYVPPGASSPLPRVRFWSIWNEPNLGVQLAPQTVDHGKLEISPTLYRRLADAAWAGLRATGHGRDTILIGEVAPAGVNYLNGPGNFAEMTPLRFLRALYCVGADYRPLRAAAASQRGCPTTAAGSSSFRSAHPVLFDASGFADHPYPQGLPPDKPTPGEPDYAELAEVPKLIRVLDTLQRVYGSQTRFPIYSTEFGYQTTPPDREAGTVSPAQAAAWLNWSEYLTWRIPRLVSYDQYLLMDSPAALFASGLETDTGIPKPGFYAYRMPIYIPVTATAKGHPLEVWGNVRPARYAGLSSHHAQRVQIQFRSASGGFRTVETVTLAGRDGYFDVLVKLPASGFVRLQWSYPHGPTIFSRTVGVTIG